MEFEIIIIGAGASGMMAGIAAASCFAENGKTGRIAIVERHPAAGRKLLATGNGFCNISNTGAIPQNVDRYYYGEDTGLIAAIIAAFPPERTIEFFEQAGVLCRTEADGRIYPFNNQSSSVRDALEARLEELGVIIFKSTEARNVRLEDGVFSISCVPAGVPAGVPAHKAASHAAKSIPHVSSPIYPMPPEQLKSKKLIIATGGKASAKLSSDGLGYPVCAALGHTVTPLYPAIVRLKTQNVLGKDLSGVKIEATLRLMLATPDRADGSGPHRVIAAESGELLFTGDGISGPPVLQLAGYMKPGTGSLEPEPLEHPYVSGISYEGDAASSAYYVLADLFPGYSNEELAGILLLRIRSLPDRSIDRYFDGLLPLKLAHAVAAKIFVTNTSRRIASVTASEIAGCISILKNMPFRITGTAGWEHAQVTAGGVRLDEVDCGSMESACCSGLYLTGEILDATGYCGGFNLQFAWASGHVAGIAAAKSILVDQADQKDQ
ncbi:MAG: BaiN/RdsA family NAD(P)/FAD-dependent oxidoreductase [Saccharofermentanales bacterium]